MSATSPLCARCDAPHGFTDADLQYPGLPAYCNACESTVCLECGRFGRVSGGVEVCVECRPPKVGEPALRGESCTCIWCGHTSTDGAFEWSDWEDASPGWECANESVCLVRFEARNEARS